MLLNVVTDGQETQGVFALEFEALETFDRTEPYHRSVRECVIGRQRCLKTNPLILDSNSMLDSEAYVQERLAEAGNRPRRQTSPCSD